MCYTLHTFTTHYTFTITHYTLHMWQPGELVSKLHAGLRLRSHFITLILLPRIEISHDCIIVEIALNSDKSIWGSRKHTISLFILHFESEKVEWPSYITSLLIMKRVAQVVVASYATCWQNKLSGISGCR